VRALAHCTRPPSSLTLARSSSCRRWHLGFFKTAMLPSSRGFDYQSGLYNAMGDHFEHTIDGGYDWHVGEVTQTGFRGNYSGELVRDDSVAFIWRLSNGSAPFFLYAPFQEAHSPYQAPAAYLDMYPELSATPEKQNLAGMLSHNDAMVGDIVDALNATGALQNSIVMFSADNGGPGGQEGVPRPSRFDSTIIDRNWPFRGQKHELYEGGVRVAGFVYSPLLPGTAPVGGTVHAIIHVTDWLPTLLTAAGLSPSARAHLPLDGTSMWGCLSGDSAQCGRTEVLLNFNTVCDSGLLGFATECPAPKAAVRVGELKLLAECYDATTGKLTGNLELYNVTNDPSEAVDLASAMPEEVTRLGQRLQFYGAQAAQVPPLSDRPPWQGAGYYCASCASGQPQGVNAAWEPWCEGDAGVPC
jgi:arylsulfatase I/J